MLSTSRRIENSFLRNGFLVGQNKRRRLFVFPEVKKAFVFGPHDNGFADKCTTFDCLTGEALADEIERKLGIKFDVIEMRHP